MTEIAAFLQGPQGPGRYLFGPTPQSTPDGIVRIGIGRDDAEVAFASPFGAVECDMPRFRVQAQGDTDPGITTQAVRSDP